VRCAAAVLAAAAALGAGVLAGGGWWLAAVLGAVAGIGAAADRHLAHPHVLATLVLVAGVVATGHEWYVVVLAAGTIGASELHAAADRTTLVRPRVPDLGRTVVASVTAGAVAALVLLIGTMPSGGPAAGAVVAALAAVVGLRVIAR
jgi:hypothetical protein